MLTSDELTRVLNNGESDCVEFTESTNDLDKFRKAICAFANDLPAHQKPGLIFIGIKDDGSCADLTIDDGLLQTLGGLKTNIFPLPSRRRCSKRITAAWKNKCGRYV